MRNTTLDRPSRIIGRYDYLPRDIERGLVDVLEKEVAMARRLESLKNILQTQADYSASAAFRSVDKYNFGRLDRGNIETFLRMNGHYASEF